MKEYRTYRDDGSLLAVVRIHDSTEPAHIIEQNKERIKKELIRFMSRVENAGRDKETCIAE